MMDQESLQQFRAEVLARRNLPTIPAVLTRIITLVDGEMTNARHLVDVIERDQALTGKILRLANSAFFGQSRRVATIPRAILLLGFSTVRNLALGVKVWEALAGGVAKQRLEALWIHSVTVALATKLLAARLCDGDPDEAFTAGLLHDVGRLVIAVRFKDDYWKAIGEDVAGASASGEPIDVVERATFGVDHAEVGGWLFEAWNLPAGIVEAVRHHHELDARPGIAGLLAIADRLVHATDVANGALRPDAEPVLALFAPRGVTPELWQAIIPELAAGESFLGDGR
ncbi:MAG: HDOD domain-containing protein [Candidatus Binatia bacterium]